MIKAEIYWIFGNRLRKISPKLLPQKAKVYLENFLKTLHSFQYKMRMPELPK